MFVHKAFLLIILSYFASFGLVCSTERVSGALKRQTLIYYEPPFESDQERADQITTHYVKQRLDNFDHQNKETFQMVSTS